MHIIWRREKEFEDFIREVASKKIKPFGGLYALVAVVESYFEFMARILLDKIELREADKKKWVHGTAIDMLAGKKMRSIDEEAKNIFHEVRKLRNDMLHDILYEPDLNRLQEFMQNCFDRELDRREKEKCSSSEEELERIFCNKITEAYAEISNKYKKQIDEKIAEYLKNL